MEGADGAKPWIDVAQSAVAMARLRRSMLMIIVLFYDTLRMLGKFVPPRFALDLSRTHAIKTHKTCCQTVPKMKNPSVLGICVLILI